MIDSGLLCRNDVFQQRSSLRKPPKRMPLHHEVAKSRKYELPILLRSMR